MECDVALAPDFKCDKSIIAEVICSSNLQAQENENKLRKCVIVCIQFACARRNKHMALEEKKIAYTFDSNTFWFLYLPHLLLAYSYC
jgi:hypothetical protein